jgi:hypothetical protein
MRVLPGPAADRAGPGVDHRGRHFGSFAAATLSDDQVDPVLDEVALRSGGQVTIVGTQVAVRKLARVGWTSARTSRSGSSAPARSRLQGLPDRPGRELRELRGRVRPAERRALDRRPQRRAPDLLRRAAKVQQLRLPSFYFRWETARDAGMLLYGAAKGRLGRIVLT